MDSVKREKTSPRGHGEHGGKQILLMGKSMGEKDGKTGKPRPSASAGKTNRDAAPGKPPGTEARKKPGGDRR